MPEPEARDPLVAASLEMADPVDAKYCFPN